MKRALYLQKAPELQEELRSSFERAVYSITHFLIRKSVLAPAVMHQGRNAFVPGYFVGIA